MSRPSNASRSAPGSRLGKGRGSTRCARPSHRYLRRKNHTVLVCWDTHHAASRAEHLIPFHDWPPGKSAKTIVARQTKSPDLLGVVPSLRITPAATECMSRKYFMHRDPGRLGNPFGPVHTSHHRDSLPTHLLLECRLDGLRREHHPGQQEAQKRPLDNIVLAGGRMRESYCRTSHLSRKEQNTKVIVNKADGKQVDQNPSRTIFPTAF